MSTQELPAGWKWVKLGDVATYINGRAFKPEDWETSGRPIIRIQNLSDPDAAYNHFSGSVDAKHIVRRGDLLISWSASLGVHIWSGPEAILNQHIFKVDEDTAIIERTFLAYAVRSVLSEIESGTHGATMKHIRRGPFENTLIPLPPTLDEQRRIAAAIDAQMAQVARARAALQAQLEAARQLMGAYLREVFESEEAQGWERVRLGEILRRETEILHPSPLLKGSATFVGLEHIESGTGRRIGALELDLASLTGRKPVFRAGDIVYGYLRPYLNKVWIAEFDGLCSVDQYVFSVSRANALAEYVAWYMSSPVYLERSPVGSNTSQLPRIRLEEVASVEMPLPDLAKQWRVAETIGEAVRVIEQLTRHLREQLDELIRYPAGILAAAFRGEV